MVNNKKKTTQFSPKNRENGNHKSKINKYFSGKTHMVTKYFYSKLLTFGANSAFQNAKASSTFRPTPWAQEEREKKNKNKDNENENHEKRKKGNT